MKYLKNILLTFLLFDILVFAGGEEDPFADFQNAIISVSAPSLSIQMSYASYKSSYSSSVQILNYLTSKNVDDHKTVEGLLLKHFEARKLGDMDMMKALFNKNESSLVEQSYSRISNYPKALKKYNGLKFIGKTYFNKLVRVRYDMVGNGATSFPMVTYARKDKDRYWLVEGVSNNYILEVFGGGHPVNSSSRKFASVNVDSLVDSKKITFFDKKNKISFKLHDRGDDQQIPFENAITIYLTPTFYQKPTNYDEIKYLKSLIDYAKDGSLDAIKAEFSASEETFLNRKNNPHIPMVANQLNTIVDVEYLFKLDGTDHCSIFYGQPKTKRVGSFVLARTGNGFELNARKGNNWLNRIVASSELMSAISYWQYKPE